MKRALKIGVIGDFNPKFHAHVVTNQALAHAAQKLELVCDVSWIPTSSLEEKSSEKILETFDALFASPGAPYQSMEGMFRGIHFAREKNVPFTGTWGGFQHTLLEYARNVLGIQDADHEESSPNASTLLISKLACSLVGQTHAIQLTKDSVAYQAYGKEEIHEKFYCNYGLNPKYRHRIDDGKLKVTGLDHHGEIRIIELASHPFFVATLFVPQTSSSVEAPHPLFKAYLKAAASYRQKS